MTGPRFQVNINGTNSEVLREQLLTVLKAVGALDKALGDAMPHGRDYQTLPGGHEVCLQDRATVAAMRQQLRGIELWAEGGADRLLGQRPRRK